MTFFSAIFSIILATMAGRYAISAELIVIMDRSVLAATLISRPFFGPLRWCMSVPGFSGLKVFLTLTGMCLCLAGSIVLGCSTLAPK